MSGQFLGNAVFSPCGLYRYRLERAAPESSPHGPTLAFIMVNPSTATETEDDQTIKMVRLFGRRHGYGRIVIGNLFAYRSKDISKLVGLADPVGPENDKHLRQIMLEADRCYAAWGAENKVPRPFRARWRDIAAMADEVEKPLYCLDHLDGGHPRHPQILKYDSSDLLWNRPE